MGGGVRELCGQGRVSVVVQVGSYRQGCCVSRGCLSVGCVWGVGSMCPGVCLGYVQGCVSGGVCPVGGWGDPGCVCPGDVCPQRVLCVKGVCLGVCVKWREGCPGMCVSRASVYSGVYPEVMYVQGGVYPLDPETDTSPGSRGRHPPPSTDRHL